MGHPDLCQGVVVVTPAKERIVLFPLGHPPLAPVYACLLNQVRQSTGTDIAQVDYTRDDRGGWLATLTLRYVAKASGTPDHVFLCEGPARTKRDARDLVVVTASALLPDICAGGRFPPLSHQRKRVGFVDAGGKVVLT